jgi:hypothetical protein
VPDLVIVLDLVSTPALLGLLDEIGTGFAKSERPCPKLGSGRGALEVRNQL